MSNGRRVVLALVMLACGAATARSYAAVWQNEETLWAHAATRAPVKPRPHVQWSLALMERRQFAHAEAVLDYADQLTMFPHVRAWDRAEAQDAIQSQRHLLSRLQGH